MIKTGETELTPDIYKNFEALANNHLLGRDYAIIPPCHYSSILILAPHAGGIEPTTSKIARLIAGDEFSLYLFEGLLATEEDNQVLHITSSNFDEPEAIKACCQADYVITIHGKKPVDRDFIMVGGRDQDLGKSIENHLLKAGFTIEPCASIVEAQKMMNICNRNRRAMGVQLEISRGLRNLLDSDEEMAFKFANGVRQAIFLSTQPDPQIDFTKIMKKLRSRMLFHSEKDFQFALGRVLQEKYPLAKIRFEKRVLIPSRIPQKRFYHNISFFDLFTSEQINEQTDAHVDIWVKYRGFEYFIELKYIATASNSRALARINADEEQYIIKWQDATDYTSYDFWYDVWRLELMTEKPGTIGIAIFLTNDHLYWEKPRNIGIKRYPFRTCDGRGLVDGVLHWNSNRSGDNSRNFLLPLKNSYDLNPASYHLRRFCLAPKQDSGSYRRQFKYLIIKIP